MASTPLGLQELTDDQYEMMRVIGGHSYTTPPATGFGSKAAQQRFCRLTGSMNPKFNPDAFDRVRERLQVIDKRERQKHMEAIGMLYLQKTAEKFVQDKNVIHPEIEKMFDPRYVPHFGDALTTLGMPIPFRWKQQQYETLENLSRLALEKCDEDRECTFTFEEWYQLFWNYAMPFNPVAYFCNVTTQQMIWTKEFIDELATYLNWRLESFGSATRKKAAPIVHVGSPLGRLAHLLNKTEKLNVPVIACHEKPMANPYLLKIPPEHQKRFQPLPVEKLTLASAMEKYEPAIVLVTDMKSNQDLTQAIRSHGPVKEYVTIGMANSYVEGNGWDTWGALKYKPQDDKTIVPPFTADGFIKTHLHPISRYGIHRFDSTECFGLTSVYSFHRAKTTFDFRTRMGFWQRRLLTRF